MKKKVKKRKSTKILYYTYQGFDYMLSKHRKYDTDKPHLPMHYGQARMLGIDKWPMRHIKVRVTIEEL